MKYLLEKIAGIYLVTCYQGNQIEHIAQFKHKANALAFVKLMQKRNKKKP